MKELKHIAGTAAAVIMAAAFFAPATAAAAAAPAAAGTSLYTVSPQQAKEMIETRDDLLVIDVRSPEEFAQGALPGSILIPFTEIAQGKRTIPRGRPLLLVCAVGGRSQAVGQYLAMNGYREVANLEGGLAAWARAKVPLPSRPANLKK